MVSRLWANPSNYVFNHWICVGLLRRIGTQEGAGKGVRQSFPPPIYWNTDLVNGVFISLILIKLRCPGRVLSRPQVAERDLTLSEKVS